MHNASYAPLLIVLLVSIVAPIVAVRVRLPAAVLLIGSGVAIGPAGMNWISETDTPSVMFLSEIGFLILMFVAGMEIDFASLRAAGVKSLAAPALTVMGLIGVAAGIGIWRNLSVISLIVVSASSVGMPLAVLQESGQIQKPLGKFVLLTASIGEFVSIFAITGYELFAEADVTLAHRATRVIKVALLFGASALLVRWARAAVWWRPEPFKRLTQHHDVAELGVRTGLFIMFAFVVLATALGVEAILGAFIGGALVAFVIREKTVLESKIAALGHGLFIPIFFIIVGVRFEAQRLNFTNVRAAAVLVLIVLSIRLVPALIFAPRNLNLRARLASAALLSAPLTLVVAIASIGRRLNAINATEEATFVLLALMLSVGFPIVFRALLPSGHAK